MSDKLKAELEAEVTEETIKNRDWKQMLIQFIKFGIIGVSNTLVSYVIYVLALFAFEKMSAFPNTDYLVAQFLGFVISVYWSFYWNRKFVFKIDETESSWWQVLLKTYVSYAFTGLFLNSVLSLVWVEYFGIPKLLAPIFNIVINVPINFLMNKFWAYRDRT